MNPYNNCFEIIYACLLVGTGEATQWWKIVDPSFVFDQPNWDLLRHLYEYQWKLRTRPKTGVPFAEHTVHRDRVYHELAQLFKNIIDIDMMHQSRHPNRRESFAMTIDFINGIPTTMVDDVDVSTFVKILIKFFIDHYLIDIKPLTWTRPILLGIS
jgi:hypothetical protein